MSKKLFVGNLPFSMTKEGLEKIFADYELDEAVIISNKFSGRSKGFGFVTIKDDAKAEEAISKLNGAEIEGRKLTVNEAKPFDPDKPRPERRFGGGGGGRFGGERRGGFRPRNRDSDNDY